MRDINPRVVEASPKPDDVDSVCPSPMPADLVSLQLVDACENLLAEAREVCAETRNHRHVAVLRRALYQKGLAPSSRSTNSVFLKVMTE